MCEEYDLTEGGWLHCALRQVKADIGRDLLEDLQPLHNRLAKAEAALAQSCVGMGSVGMRFRLILRETRALFAAAVVDNSVLPRPFLFRVTPVAMALVDRHLLICSTDVP